MITPHRIRLATAEAPVLDYAELCHFHAVTLLPSKIMYNFQLLRECRRF